LGKYYLAIDIGASSGRHILGYMDNGTMKLEEVYRFNNDLVRRDGHLCWDLDRLFDEIKNGLKECKKLNKIPVSMGIDTWAVDFVLLDKDDKILGDTIGYRDHRTNGMDEEVYKFIPEEDLYARTGIQKQLFNTIYQLMAIKTEHPQHLEEAEDLLMLPDYFNFLLTGNKLSEYTNATSTNLVNANKKDWDFEIIEKLGYKKDIFKPLSLPGTPVGEFKEDIAKEVGFSCQVILPATHDTACAVMAVPAVDDDFIYISSGTWSLMGIESKFPITTKESMESNLTNEGGYDYRFRFLKNIMGLWMIQSVRRELDKAYSFPELAALAEESTNFPSRVDVNDASFLAPDSMIEAIKDYCKKTNQQVPETVGEISTCIYQSLAQSYGQTVKEIENITGRTYSRIHIVGGGSNADYLNELTAKYTNKEVHAGPGEATAIGNIVAQLLKDGVFKNLKEARESIYKSFNIKKV
jgi:rhamnulokinase